MIAEVRPGPLSVTVKESASRFTPISIAGLSAHSHASSALSISSLIRICGQTDRPSPIWAVSSGSLKNSRARSVVKATRANFGVLMIYRRDDQRSARSPFVIGAIG